MEIKQMDKTLSLLHCFSCFSNSDLNSAQIFPHPAKSYLKSPSQVSCSYNFLNTALYFALLHSRNNSYICRNSADCNIIVCVSYPGFKLQVFFSLPFASVDSQLLFFQTLNPNAPIHICKSSLVQVYCFLSYLF